MLHSSEQGNVAALVPWKERDGYVAETAVRLDKVHAHLTAVTEEQAWIRDAVRELRDENTRNQRLRSFDESLRNSRDVKTDEIVRTMRDLKDRMGAIEGPRSAFGGLTYKSFDSIDARLVQFAAMQKKLERIETRNYAMFLCSLAMMSVTLISRFY